MIYPLVMARGLERSWIKRELIHLLARGESSNTELAEKYGVTQPAIANFKHRHLIEIEQVKGDIENEFAGLWIASKLNRVAEYQADVERISDVLDTEPIEEMADVPDDRLFRIKLAILRQVAEELGQLKQEIDINGTMTYTVQGIDMSKLS